jgi:hypothetical protein
MIEREERPIETSEFTVSMTQELESLKIVKTEAEAQQVSRIKSNVAEGERDERLNLSQKEHRATNSEKESQEEFARAKSC